MASWRELLLVPDKPSKDAGSGCRKMHYEPFVNSDLPLIQHHCNMNHVRNHLVLHGFKLMDYVAIC